MATLAESGERVPFARFCRGLARVLIAACGACSVAWTISTFSSLRHEVFLAASARHILSGEKYSSEEIGEFGNEIAAIPAGSFSPSSLSDVAVIRLRAVEAKLASHQATAADLDTLEGAVRSALARNPAASFLWLISYWVQGIRSGNAAATQKLLRMSYLLAPNEAWIAVRRNPLALGNFSSLPADLGERVVSEFAGLVQSGLYWNAANILAGPGWPVRQRLVAGLAHVDEGARHQFARALAARDIRDVAIPGVKAPRARPF